MEPSSLPPASQLTLEYPDASQIAGNAPFRAKQLALNTFASYGVGDAEAFGHAAGRKVRFVRIDVDIDVQFRDGASEFGLDTRGAGRIASKENSE